MAKNKGLPKYQNPSPLPAARLESKTAEETTAEVLAAIRQHEPEVQNVIVNKVMQEIVLERHQTYDLALKDQQKAGENFEKFMANTQGIAEFVKEYNSRNRV